MKNGTSFSNCPPQGAFIGSRLKVKSTMKSSNSFLNSCWRAFSSMSMRTVYAVIFLSLAAFGQTVVHLNPTPRQQFLDNNGTPLAGGYVYTYQSGTTTPQATYTDSTGTSVNTNPIVLDSGGFANIWLDDSEAYKECVQDATHVQLYCIDGIQNPQSAAAFDPSSPPPIGDVLPNTIDGTVVTAHSRFVGNLTGNVTGNVGGNVTGNVTGNLTGNVTGGTIDGVIGSVVPAAAHFTTVNASGTITGNVTGNLTGNVTGNVTGNLTGNADTATLATTATTATTALALQYYQAASFGASCTTGGGSYDTCSSSYTIPVAYADTSYIVTCSPTGSVTGHPFMQAITKSGTNSIAIQISNGTADGAVASSFAGFDCMFFHN